MAKGESGRRLRPRVPFGFGIATGARSHAEGIVKMVVAAKSEGAAVAVSEAEGRAFAERHGCLFATTSSKLGEGVLPAFTLLSSHVLATQESKEEAREGLWLNAPMPSDGRAAAGKRKVGCC